MKRTIREGMFETNSSSTHSVIIHDSYLPDMNYNDYRRYDIYLSEFMGDDPHNGILGIHFGVFGDDSELIGGFRRKLSYLMTLLAGSAYRMSYCPKGDYHNRIEIETEEDWDRAINDYFLKIDKVKEVLEMIQKNCPSIKGFRFFWSNENHEDAVQVAYRKYCANNNIPYNEKLPKLEDIFYLDYYPGSSFDFMIGFGESDMSNPMLEQANIDYLEKFLFNDYVEVLITDC